MKVCSQTAHFLNNRGNQPNIMMWINFIILSNLRNIGCFHACNYNITTNNIITDCWNDNLPNTYSLLRGLNIMYWQLPIFICKQACHYSTRTNFASYVVHMQTVSIVIWCMCTGYMMEIPWKYIVYSFCDFQTEDCHTY